jgi:hypothetical protein
MDTQPKQIAENGENKRCEENGVRSKRVDTHSLRISPIPPGFPNRLHNVSEVRPPVRCDEDRRLVINAP